MKRICSVAMLLCVLVPACLPAETGISERDAVRIAREFLLRQPYAAQYDDSSPLVSAHGDEWHVQFNDRRKHVRPGVCIVSVHRATGAVRLVPAE